MKNLQVSDLLRSFFVQNNLSMKPDSRESQHTFVYSGFRWNTQADEIAAQAELATFANWAKIGRNDKNRPSTSMVLPFPVEVVAGYCDQLALETQNKRWQPPLDDNDIVGYVRPGENGEIVVLMDREVAADHAKPLLNSENWDKDDDLVWTKASGIHYRLGLRLVQVYLRLDGDTVVGIYDCARDGVIAHGIGTADLAA